MSASGKLFVTTLEVAEKTVYRNGVPWRRGKRFLPPGVDHYESYRRIRGQVELARWSREGHDLGSSLLEVGQIYYLEPQERLNATELNLTENPTEDYAPILSALGVPLTAVRRCRGPLRTGIIPGTPFCCAHFQDGTVSRIEVSHDCDVEELAKALSLRITGWEFDSATLLSVARNVDAARAWIQDNLDVSPNTDSGIFAEWSYIVGPKNTPDERPLPMEITPKGLGRRPHDRRNSSAVDVLSWFSRRYGISTLLPNMTNPKLEAYEKIQTASSAANFLVRHFGIALFLREQDLPPLLLFTSKNGPDSLAQRALGSYFELRESVDIKTLNAQAKGCPAVGVGLPPAIRYLWDKFGVDLSRALVLSNLGVPTYEEIDFQPQYLAVDFSGNQCSFCFPGPDTQGPFWTPGVSASWFSQLSVNGITAHGHIVGQTEKWNSQATKLLGALSCGAQAFCLSQAAADPNDPSCLVPKTPRFSTETMFYVVQGDCKDALAVIEHRAGGLDHLSFSSNQEFVITRNNQNEPVIARHVTPKIDVFG